MKELTGWGKEPVKPTRMKPGESLWEFIKRSGKEEGGFGSTQSAINAGAAEAGKVDKQAQDLYQRIANAGVPPKPADITKLVPSLTKLHPWKTPGDALISVGNFLGAGSGAISNVAERQLDAARESLTQLQEMNDKLDKLTDDGGGSDMDFGS